jgi:hypothetical protein
MAEGSLHLVRHVVGNREAAQRNDQLGSPSLPCHLQQLRVPMGSVA